MLSTVLMVILVTNTDTAAESAATAQQYSGKPPKPENGTWWIWDAEKGTYVNTNISCELTGPTGNGIQSIQLTQGNHTPGSTDIYTVTMTDGSKYNIGIQKPFDESGEAITSVQLKDQTVVTSGIYERYFKKNGKLYHHILDPRTGYPCENNLYSVSIITDSSTKADALSTTCFLLGYEKGMELIQSMDGVKAIFITDDEKVHKIGI